MNYILSAHKYSKNNPMCKHLTVKKMCNAAGFAVSEHSCRGKTEQGKGSCGLPRGKKCNRMMVLPESPSVLYHLLFCLNHAHGAIEPCASFH